MSVFNKKNVHLYRGNTINDWSGITSLIIEDRPDDGMKKIIHEALAVHKIPVRGATPEIHFFIDSFVTGANL